MPGPPSTKNDGAGEGVHQFLVMRGPSTRLHLKAPSTAIDIGFTPPRRAPPMAGQARPAVAMMQQLPAAMVAALVEASGDRIPRRHGAGQQG